MTQTAIPDFANATEEELAGFVASFELFTTTCIETGKRVMGIPHKKSVRADRPSVGVTEYTVFAELVGRVPNENNEGNFIWRTPSGVEFTTRTA